MAIKSSAERYGTVAILVHWTSALLIIGLLLSGFRASAALDAATKAGILRFHLPMGLLILTLTVFRIAWWQFADRKPASLPSDRLQSAAAKIVHLLFYVVIVGMAA
ncbi:MAG: cytochrome b, partial [Bosea sp. (in: a-proteobacteria)]